MQDGQRLEGIEECRRENVSRAYVSEIFGELWTLTPISRAHDDDERISVFFISKIWSH